jgi:nicotinamidase-related amidase
MHDFKLLPMPPHFVPDKVGEVWKVDYQNLADKARDWSVRNGIQPAAKDKLRVALLLIDLQNTFCLPNFELFVAGRSGAGAVEDSRRLCEFIYRNLGSISHIHFTLDTHRAVQIFHPFYWVDADGNHPAPLTMITHEDVRSGRWRFNLEAADTLGMTPEQAQEHLLHYTRELKTREKYDLTIWPYHAMIGGIGHALVAAVEEAIFFHTIARAAQATITIKGEYPNTESYSAIGPEVLYGADGEPIASKDESFLGTVIEHDMVLIAGQAKSHCMVWTIADLLDQITAYDRSLTQKIYLLEDCTSPVVVPGVVDYTDQADEAYQRFSAAGMHIVRSTDPMAEWPAVEELSALA